MVAIKAPLVGRKTRFRTPTQEELEEIRDRLAPFFEDTSPLSPSLDTGTGELPPFTPPSQPYPYESGLEPATIRPAEEPWRPGGTPSWLRGQPLNQLLRNLALRAMPEEALKRVAPEEEPDITRERLEIAQGLLNPNDPLAVLGGLPLIGGPALQLGPKVGGTALRVAQTVGEIGLEAMGQPVRRLGTEIAEKALPTVRRVLEEEAGGIEAGGFSKEELANLLKKTERTAEEEQVVQASLKETAKEHIARQKAEALKARAAREAEIARGQGEMPGSEETYLQRIERLGSERGTRGLQRLLRPADQQIVDDFLQDVGDRIRANPAITRDELDNVRQQGFDIHRAEEALENYRDAEGKNKVGAWQEFLDQVDRVEYIGEPGVSLTAPVKMVAETVQPARLTSAEIREATDLGIPLQPPGNEEAMRTAITQGKERGLTGRMRQAETVTFPDGSVISKAAHDILQTDIQTYNQLANKATMAEADRRIATDYTGTLSDLLDLSKPTTPDLMGAGVRLLERGSKEDLALFQDVVAAMDARATTVGQSEQILSQIRTISPEGAMLEAHKVLQKMLLAKGGKITLAEEKALATKGIEVQREIVTAEGKKIVSDAQEMAKFQLEQARAARDIAKANWQEAQQTQKNILADLARREREAEKQAQQFQRNMLRASSDIERQDWREQRDALLKTIREERRAVNADWLDKQHLAREAEKHAQDMEVLTGRLVPEARKRARNLERAAVNYGKQAVAKNGLALSDQMAANFMERARAIQALEPGFEQTRRYHQLITDISNFVPPTRWETAMDMYNIPLVLKFAYDAGVMFRQGGLLGLRNPDIWLDTWGPLIKSFSDPAYAERIQTQVASMPLANVMHEAGSAFDELWERTEFFSSKLANKLRGIAGSQRSFTVPMNKIRWESLSRVYESWLPKGYDLIANPINTLEEFSAITGKSVQEAKDMALLYNNLTLKSNIPWLKAQVGILRLPFFAPGYTLSLPEAIGRTIFSPGARKEGARILGSYYGFVIGAETMGDLAGIWDAELDPRSSNFGKVRFKGTQTYIDPTLGLAGWLRTVAQVVPTPGPEGWQPYHKTATGNLVVQPSAWQDGPLARFLRGKTHMIPGELWSWAEGQNIVGEKRVLSGVNAETALSVLNMAKSLFAPLTPENIIEGVLDDGLRGGVLSLSNIVGLNVSSYTTSRDIQQRTTDQLFPGKKYEELDRGQMSQVNDSPEIKVLFAQMDREGNIAEKTTQAYDTYNEGKKVLEIGRPATATQSSEVGLRDYIRAGMKGAPLVKQIKKFKEARYNLAKTTLTPDVLAYSTQDKKLKPHDIYAQMWLDVPLEEDLVTGELNFEKQEAERDAILRDAQPSLKLAGRTSDYITKKGEGTFRGKSAEDPEVMKVLDEYDRNIEILKPYYALREDLLKRIPVYANAVENYKRAEAQQDVVEIMRWKNPYNAFNTLLSKQREAMRNRDKEIFDAGVRLGKWNPRLSAPVGTTQAPSLKVGTGIKAGTPVPVGR